MKVYYCEINHLFTNYLLNKWMTMTKKSQVKQVQDVLQKKQSLLGDMLTRFVIHKHYDIHFLDIEYDYNKYWKPYIHQKNCYFNCSHSDKGVFVAIDDEPIGIDAEKIKALENTIEISKVFLTKSEIEYLCAAKDCYHLELFYRMWTVKESYVKLLGTGLSIPPDKITIDLKTHTISASHIKNNYSSANYVCFRHEDYIVSIASRKHSIENKIMPITIEELDKFIKKIFAEYGR